MVSCPDLVPEEVPMAGAKVTETEAALPAATAPLGGFALNRGVELVVLKFSGAVPVFWIVRFREADVPSVTFPKFRLVGATDIEGAGSGHSARIAPPSLMRTVVEVASAMTCPAGVKLVVLHIG
jgi:hypothetical protein